MDIMGLWKSEKYRKGPINLRGWKKSRLRESRATDQNINLFISFILEITYSNKKII